MKNWLSKILIFIKLKYQDISILHTTKIFSYDEYNRHTKNHQKDDAEKFLFEKSLLPKTQTKFIFSGYCYVCKKIVDFLVDFQNSYEVNNILMPNWRERLACPSCHLVNRTRATVHLFEQECKPMHDSKIYITEQTTPLYSLLKTAYPNTFGSEYIGDVLGYGDCNQNGIRNEDLTKLSFNNDEFDFILSFDVFEHIPNYRKALLECYRCLKPGGSLFFSVPFIKTSEKNIIRAYINENGTIEHVLPPEYHGDPLSSDGILCYNHFGWELLDELKSIGFENVHALLYWSKELGYLGGKQVQFKSTKKKSS